MLGLLKHEVKTRDFILQGIQWWPIINLVTLIHVYLHLISLEIVVDYLELRSFQETQVNLNGLQKKLDITYPWRNSYNGISWTKLLNYSEDLGLCWICSVSVGTTTFSKNHTGIIFLYDWCRKSFHLLAGEAKFGIGEEISTKLSTREATGVHLTEALRQGAFRNVAISDVQQCSTL